MTERQDVFQDMMKKGASVAWDQQWDQAAVFYRQALAEFPNDPQALTNLGLALFELRKYEEAILIYQRAGKASPEDPVPVEKLAQIYERISQLDQASQASLHAAELYLKNRDVSKAINNWLRVERLKPENVQAHYRLAQVYERIGEKQKAVSEFLSVASLLQSAGNLEKAVFLINQGLKIIPDHEEALNALALLRDRKPLPKPQRPPGGTAPLFMPQTRQPQTSLVLDSEVNNLDPIESAHQQALAILAGLLFETADESIDEQATRRDLQSIVQDTGPAPKQADRSRMLLHLSKVMDLLSREQNTQAIEQIERAMEVGLEHTAAFFELGYLYTEIGQQESAVRQLQRAVQNEEFAFGSHLLMADLFRKLGRVKEASIEFLEALKLADAQVVPPDQADDLRQLYDPLIENYQQQANREIQARICENITSLLIRTDWKDHLRQARRQLPAQEVEGPPIPLAEILTEAHSSQIIESIGRVYQFARMGKLHSAMEEAFYALQIAPTYLPLHTYMGELLMQEGHVEGAITKFKIVARTYNTRGEPRRAIDLYRKIVEIAPTDFNARSQLINQLVSHNQAEEAVTEYLKMADVYYNLADLEMVRKTYIDAFNMAQQSRVDRSHQVKILHKIADIYLQSLDWRQALHVFEQIRTIQPDDEKSRYNLIELNYRLGSDPQGLTELDKFISYLGNSGKREKAIKFLENLVKENPGRIPFRRRLADLYHLVGNDKQSIDQLDIIGEALLDAGDQNGATQVIEAILTLNPPNKADYQRLLSQLKGD